MFQKSLGFGSTETGIATFRAMLVKDGALESLPIDHTDPAIQTGGLEVGEYLRRVERNPARAAAMARARQRLAQSINASTDTQGAATVNCASLAALRLQAGLSQAQLATRMGTHQPAIARWERNPSAMQHANMKAFAVALGCTVGAVADAIDKQTSSTAA